MNEKIRKEGKDQKGKEEGKTQERQEEGKEIVIDTESERGDRIFVCRYGIMRRKDSF